MKWRLHQPRFDTALADYDLHTVEMLANTPRHVVEVRPDVYRVLTDVEYELWWNDHPKWWHDPPTAKGRR